MRGLIRFSEPGGEDIPANNLRKTEKHRNVLFYTITVSHNVLKHTMRRQPIRLRLLNGAFLTTTFATYCHIFPLSTK